MAQYIFFSLTLPNWFLDSTECNTADTLCLIMESRLSEFEDHLKQHYPPHTTKINFGSTYHHPVGQQGIELLLRYLHWDIQQLNITMHRVGDSGLQLLLQHQTHHHQAWTTLTEFVCDRNDVSDAGLTVIEHVQWHRLQFLSLEHNHITHFGVHHLVKASFQHLRKLSLDQNRIGSAGCQALSLSLWSQLEFLDLNYNEIGNEGVRYLALVEWPLLQALNVSNNKINAEGMHHLQQANWPRLKRLSLNRNRVGVMRESMLTDLGCVRLGRMRTGGLRVLNMFGNQLSLNGLKVIFRSGLLEAGCFLELMKNNFKWIELRPLLVQYDLFCNQFMD